LAKFLDLQNAFTKKRSQKLKKMTRFYKILLLCLALVPFLSLHHTFAAANTSPSKPPTGITVSPAFAQISIQATETEHPFQFRMTNDQNFPVTLSLSSADFNALNDTGGLFFVGSNPTALQKKYGLAKWMSIPSSTVTVPAKQTANVEVSILNQDTLTSGGHYGAVMISIAENTAAPTAQNKISVQPVASLLLFVNKVGGDIYKLNLNNISITRSFFGLPSNATLRFYNGGNTHLLPRGTINITNSGGKLVGRGVINENSNIILPETYRRFSTPLIKISGIGIMGKYKMDVNYRFDGYDQFRTYQTSFFVIAPLGFAIIGLIFAAAGAGVYWLSKRRIQLKAFRKEFQKQWQTMYARITFVRPMKKKIKKKIPVKIKDK
jgi:hypothetical protein